MKRKEKTEEESGTNWPKRRSKNQDGRVLLYIVYLAAKSVGKNFCSDEDNRKSPAQQWDWIKADESQRKLRELISPFQ